MADTITNDTTPPTKYVTILDLREQWLKKQQQQEEEGEKPELKMADIVTTSNPVLPTNYVTIRDLREQWLKKQQQQEEEEVANRVKEKLQGTAGDAGFDEKPQFQNPRNFIGEAKTHKGEIGEIGFRRNPNWNNRRPFRRNFDGENRFVKKVNDSRVEAPEIVDGLKVAAEIDAPRKLKASEEFGAVDVKNTTQETTEIDVGAGVQAESDALGQLKDAQTVKEEQKKLKNRLRKKLWKENVRNRRIAEKEGQAENLVSQERNSVEIEGTRVLVDRIPGKEKSCGEKKGKESQEGVEDEEKMKEIIWVEKRVVGKEKRNVSKIGRTREKKMSRSPYGVRGRAVEFRAKMKDVPLLENPIPVVEKHSVTEKWKCGECEEVKSAKMKDVSVVEERNLLKEKLNVSKNEEKAVGDNQECLNDLAVEIEGKLKEILLLEDETPATEMQNKHVNEEFEGNVRRGNVRKNGEMHLGDHRARGDRKFEGSLRGRWSRGEGGRRVYEGYSWPKHRVYRGEERRDTRLVWVKKSEVSG